MIAPFNEYEIDEDQARLDFGRVHAWLTETYWSPGISRERVERAARFSSLAVGAYRNGEQTGYLRVVSDRTRFAYLCDVYVDAAHRGRGLGKALVRFALAHPEHQNLRRWLLVTRDAHGVYRDIGFETLPNPENWLLYRPESSKDAGES